MKAIVFDKIGSPSDVLRLADVPIPEVAEGEVLVKMIAASINPGDFLFIQNLYPDPKKPHFPGQIAGNHGAGIITKIGKNVSLKPGTLVAFSYYNTWAGYAAVPAEWLIPLPSDYPVEKAAQFVNLVTSWDFLDASQGSAGSMACADGRQLNYSDHGFAVRCAQKRECHFNDQARAEPNRSESLGSIGSDRTGEPRPNRR